MKRIITMVVEDSNTPSTDITAFSKESANIFITAKDFDTALILLEAGREKADNACATWEDPAPEPKQEEQPQKHYAVKRIAQKDIEDYITDFEASDRGKRFIKGLKNARTFRYGKDNGGLPCSEFEYLCMLTEKDIFNGLTGMFSLGYRRGYNKAKKDCKA